MDDGKGRRVLARFRRSLFGNCGELARLDLVSLGEDDAVTYRGLVQHFHHLAVTVLQPVAAVDQHQRTLQRHAPAQISAHQPPPLLNHLYRRLGKAIAGHVDEAELGGITHFEEVQFLCPARCHGSAGNRPAPSQRVDQRALAHVRSPTESHFRKIRTGQEFQFRRGQQEVHPAREQAAGLLSQGFFFRCHRRFPLSPFPLRQRVPCPPHPSEPSPSAADAWNRGTSAAPA